MDIQNLSDTTADPAIEQDATQQDVAPDVDPNDFYNGESTTDPANEPEGGDPDLEGEGVEQTTPIDAPLSWAKDAKEVFASLPREAQEIIAIRERDREAGIQAKFREASSTRQQVETDARTALQTIMQNHQQKLAEYAQRIEVQQPDLRLLNSSDPAHRDLYFQQEAAYRNAIAQREDLTQQQQQAQQHAEAIAFQQEQAELQAEHALLEDKLGSEWSDPSARAKLLGDLTPIAAELGYSPELIAQARAADILAMRQASEWKAKAAKFDQLNKAKMVPVRAAKSIPPVARPGSPAASRAPVDIVASMYPDDVRRN